MTLAKKIIRHNTNGYTYYTYGDLGEPLYSKSATNIIYGQIFASQNGKHIAYVRLNQRLDNFEFISINLTTHEEKRIGIPIEPTTYFYLLFKNIAISNDGRYLAANMPLPLYDNDSNINNTRNVIKIWQLDNCLIDYDVQYTGGLMTDVCESRLIDEQLANIPQEDRNSNIYSMEFLPDNSELRLFHKENSLSSLRGTKLSLPNFVSVPPLQYLALGDSYSSGEGDIRGRGDPVSRYYLEGTNISGNANAKIPEEKCHTSPLSYPFRLQSMLNIPAKDMKSVACSGATRVDVEGWSNVFIDKDGNDAGYRGQKVNDTPRLEVLTSEERVDYLSEAYDRSLPGRIQQIEFIRKYKPKVLTLTIGGNDIGFPNILRECAYLTTCSYVNKDGKRSSGIKIDAMYTSLRDMYIALKQASPETKIYAIGYPQFISTALNYCGSTIVLDSAERNMIKNGVSYLNSIIKAAASAANVYYVDIEDSLKNHKLCEPSLFSQPYVNGLLTAVFLEESESFHPDHNGHRLIADQIYTGLKGQSLIDFDKCTNNAIIFCPENNSIQKPEIPSYFAPQDTFDKITSGASFVSSAYEDIMPAAISSFKRGASAILTFHTGELEASSNGWIEIHSTPVKLSEFTANSDGSLKTTVNIPHDTALGYHTIHVISKTHSGEPIDLYQTVKIISDNPNDTDGDGINNNQDTCEFIQEKGSDYNNNHIDDACDFSEPPHTLEQPPSTSKSDNIPGEDTLNASAPQPIVARFEPSSDTTAKYITRSEHNRLAMDNEKIASDISHVDIKKDNNKGEIVSSIINRITLPITLLTCLGIILIAMLAFIGKKVYNKHK
jgi:lysophospholipase L1-like esterase